MKLKLMTSMKILATLKKCLTLVITLLSQNIMIIQKKISGWQNEDETAGFAIEEFVGLKPKMYSYLVNDNSEHETAGAAIAEFIRLKPKMYSYLVNDNSDYKSAKSVDKSIVVIMSHNEKKMFY